MEKAHRRVAWSALAWLAAALAAGSFASATSEASAGRTDSFAGSCSLEGTVKFDPPATNTLAPLTYSYEATGTCSGTLNSRSVSEASVKMRQSGPADGSCLRAQTTAPGPGTIRFADGTKIDYTVEFVYVLTEGEVTFRGSHSGSAHGHGTFLTDRTSPDVAEQCAGEGAEHVPMDLSLTTDSPLVSQRSKGGRG